MNPDGSITNQVADFLNDIPLKSPQEERQMTKSWVETAAFHARNEEYYHAERDKLARILIGREGKRLCQECGLGNGHAGDCETGILIERLKRII
jgi:hypothetical protein